MWVLDVETLATESTCAILSVAILHFDETNQTHKPTYEELLDSSFFVKLSIKDQIDNYSRIVEKSTLNWWKTQSKEIQEISLTPKKSDLLAKDATKALRSFIKLKSKNAKKEIC